MFCKNCGQQLAEGAAFCPNCGMAVTQPDMHRQLLNSRQLNRGPRSSRPTRSRSSLIRNRSSLTGNIPGTACRKSLRSLLPAVCAFFAG